MLSLREWGCAAGGRRGSPRVLEGRHQARSRGGASAAGSRTCALLRAFPRLPWSACVWGTVGVRSHRWQGSSGWGEQRGGGAAWGCRKACRLQWGSLASCRWDLPARPLPCSAHPFPAGPARTPGSCRGTQVYFLPLKCTSGSGVHGVCVLCAEAAAASARPVTSPLCPGECGPGARGPGRRQNKPALFSCWGRAGQQAAGRPLTWTGASARGAFWTSQGCGGGRGAPRGWGQRAAPGPCPSGPGRGSPPTLAK